MRRLFALALAVLMLSVLSASAEESPVKWSAGVKDLGEGLYELTATAKIDDGWHIYDFGPYELGPQPTAVTYDLPEGASLEGDLSASREPFRYQDPNFGIEIGCWEGEVTLSQKIRGREGDKITMTVKWMVCNPTVCTPPDDQTFELTLGQPEETAVNAGNETIKVVKDAIIIVLVLIVAVCLVLKFRKLSRK